ncbi:DNA processing protein DprA [Psychrosphaera saromensis]|jgi:DNA processing protein|uniref:DNA protecting protein DprA n=1 Tax=Psychrosphaera saromensis TaxID=716813 RepID=A0A2S7USC9_9GAMM|nr:DNA-processing protein DprA [Psychrosphaera saromensis]PQJ52853.1 DNA protecting protein DprA [Psychrosphaera saromensis]GHB71749.1 DNA processing protein DprA [Psychrosphaera saromensis]GLQ13358.1 DNA processing protein DprA [Psychrosphaera saromensis]
MDEIKSSKLLSKSELQLWLVLFMCPKLGIVALKRLELLLPNLLGIFKLPDSELPVFKLTPMQISKLRNPDWHYIDRLMEWLDKHNVSVIPFNHEFYPTLLLNTSRPPVLLFTQGNIELLNQVQMAFVGSRNPTAYGCQVTKNLVAELVRLNLVITSGLAIGIDGIAHKAALSANGSTIAVLGSGLNNVYPKRHLSLAEQIVEQNGLLISEFLPDVPPIQFNFPKRNRIIAGLSNGTVVVEAAIKSGSLITAQSAVEEGRDVFAVPGSIYNALSEGCHHLIKQGAKLITCVDDITEEYSGLPQPVHYSMKKGLAGDKLLASVGHDTTPVDVIVQQSNMPLEQVLERLLSLEVEGLIMSVPGGYLKVCT